MSGLYSDEEVDSAAAAEIFLPEQVTAFRAFVTHRRLASPADDESLRFISGFNDVFVSIAIIMLLVALGILGAHVNALLAVGAIIAASWGLSEYFTRRRRLALPTIILALAWMGGWVFLMLSFTVKTSVSDVLRQSSVNTAPDLRLVALSAIISAAAGYAYWWRFRAPVSVAAGLLAPLGFLIGIIVDMTSKQMLPPLMFLAGVICFAFAMWWDSSDPERHTRRSDIAFWLHLVAAPLLVHPIFKFFELGGDVSDLWASVMAITLYLGISVLALVINRRALMISALVYLLYAMKTFFDMSKSTSLSLTLSALIVASLLLMLSIYWGSARRLVLRLVPDRLRAVLPSTQ